MNELQNHVLVRLASNVGDSDVQLHVQGAASPFKNPPDPAPNSGLATLTLCDDPRTPTRLEIVTYTTRTLNPADGSYVLGGVARAQEGTTALSWVSGEWALQEVTREVLDSIDGVATATAAEVTAARDGEASLLDQINALQARLAEIEDYNFDRLTLGAIAGTIASPAVDLFLYNTGEDDDPNWINDASASWYNETLNTATRGAARPFPRLALLVLEADKLTIYDATDPALPMWMVFIASGSSLLYYNSAPYPLSCLAAKNGIIYVGNAVYDIYIPDFVHDTGFRYSNIGKRTYGGKIADRNASKGYGTAVAPGVVDRAINDIALTILPDTPIDPVRKMRTPTVAVATDGGVSVIHADGGVTSSNHSSLTHFVSFTSENYLRANVFNNIHDYADNYLSDSFLYSFYYSNNGAPKLFLIDKPGYYKRIVDNAIGFNGGLNLLKENRADPANGAIAAITGEYNTGWMHGAVKGAWLADTTEEAIGVDEYNELVTNGDFDTDSVWTKGTGWSISGGVASCDGTQTAETLLSQTIAGIAEGTIAEFSFTVSNYVSGGIRFNQQADGKENMSIQYGNGTYTGTFEVIDVVGGDTVIEIRAASDFVGDIDNVSVKYIGNLIENGEFTYDITGWTAHGTAALAVSSGQLQVTSSAAYDGAKQTVQTEVGKRYKLTFDVGASTSNTFAYVIQGTTLNTPLTNSARSVEYEFVADQTSAEIRLVNVGAEATLWDNITVRLADPDRSVNNKGLEVYGEFDKSPVAAGAELVKYRQSFAGSNKYYLRTRNNPIDGVGASDNFHFLFWAFPDDLPSNRYWFDLADAAGAARFYVLSNSSEQIVVTGLVQSNALVVGLPHLVSIRRLDGTLYIDINGVTHDSAASSIGYGASGSYLTLFNRYDFVSYEAGSMALFRCGTSAPTIEQVRAFYEDEKALFQPGAKCTLPGSSDVVNCLAYNRWRDTLHVGTGAGKATFKGLLNADEDASGAVTVIDALGDYEVSNQ